MKKDSRSELSVANLVWVAVALLHAENKEKDVFQVKQIFQKAKDLGLSNATDETLMMHISLHCVANAKAQPNTHRKLFRMASGWYRLYRPDDPFDPSREKGRTAPLAEEIPQQYRYLLDWYNEYSKKQSPTVQESKDQNHAIFAKIEKDKTLKLPDDICDFLQVDDGDYLAFIMKAKGEILLKKARMKLEI
jgi:hypothetical protein